MEKSSHNLLEEKINNLVQQAVKNQVFTACSIGFVAIDEKSSEKDIFSYGYTAGDERIFPVDDETFFDLASLTKPLVTSLSLLVLLQEGRLHIDDKVQVFFERDLAAKKHISLFHLLTHSSGLPAHRPYFKKLLDIPQPERMEKITERIFHENLVFNPGTANLYSDLGFILLGRIIEKVTGESLDAFWERKIITPLKLNNRLFFASKCQKGSEVYADTGECGWSKMRLCGMVHDDNCRALGGVAGHAGLFGTARAVLTICENIILQYRGVRQHPSYNSENLRKVLAQKHGSWAFGFDTPTIGSSSSGSYFSDLAIGHLGFTGTSFWIDLRYGIAIVLLTNRVISGNSTESIRTFRPLLHDAIMEFLLKNRKRS